MVLTYKTVAHLDNAIILNLTKCQLEDKKTCSETKFWNQVMK